MTSLLDDNMASLHRVQYMFGLGRYMFFSVRVRQGYNVPVDFP